MTKIHGFTAYCANCESMADRLAANSAWPESEVRWLKKQIGRHGNDLSKLSRYSKNGQTRQARTLMRQIVSGYAGRACGLLTELGRQEKRTNECHILNWQLFDKQVGLLPSKTGQADSVQIYLKKKSCGGFREICNPGPRVRASQNTICQVIKACTDEASYDYNATNFGQAAAVDQVSAALMDVDDAYVVLFDIRNFFPSVKPKHFEWLGLPRKIVGSCICFTDNVSLSIHHGTKGETKVARQGLPQGAPASAKIASAVLGRELRHIGGGLGKVTYVDDGVIGACSRADAEEVAKALHTRLANLNGGPIGLGRLEVCSAIEGFVFLGYWIRKVIKDGQATVKCTPSHAAKQRARRRLFGRLRQKGVGLCYDAAVKNSQDYIANWRKSFSHWTPDAMELENLEGEVLCWVEDFFSGWQQKKFPQHGAIKS